jgi:hypothetical protein
VYAYALVPPACAAQVVRFLGVWQVCFRKFSVSKRKGKRRSGLMIPEMVQRTGVTRLTVRSCTPHVHILGMPNPDRCVLVDQEIDMKQERHRFWYCVDLFRRNHRPGALRSQGRGCRRPYHWKILRMLNVFDHRGIHAHRFLRSQRSIASLVRRPVRRG